jgi:hypothetical protein
MDTAAWYACLPYGDRLYRITIPQNALWQLLTANAQRLLMQDSYMESRGMLHFSRQLRYRVRLSGATALPEITWIELNGEALERGNSPELVLYTHAYVAEGMAGYEGIFNACGASRCARQPTALETPVRQVLWSHLREALDGARPTLKCDQRLTVDHD